MLVEERREHTLAEEAAARARAAEELRLAEGAFPALGGGGGGSGGGGGVPSAGAGAKGGVLSLDGKLLKRGVKEAYRVAAEEKVGDNADGLGRVPPPKSLREVQYLRVPRGPATRWSVSKYGQDSAKYVAEA